MCIIFEFAQFLLDLINSLKLEHMDKKVTLTMLSMAVFFALGFMMPQNLLAQSGDQTQVLQKIISLPDLQKYYPVSSNVKQIVIQQHPVSFPGDLKLSDSGSNVVFKQMAETEAAKTPAFFKFRSVEINQNSAKVVCHYFYNYNYQTKKSGIVEVNAELSKSGAEWKFVKSSVKQIQ